LRLWGALLLLPGVLLLQLLWQQVGCLGSQLMHLLQEGAHPKYEHSHELVLAVQTGLGSTDHQCFYVSPAMCGGHRLPVAAVAVEGPCTSLVQRQGPAFLQLCHAKPLQC